MAAVISISTAVGGSQEPQSGLGDSALAAVVHQG